MKVFAKLARIELVLIYLVIIAGSVVRMTGSGMGCPDWPKCFGHLIPPTEQSQIEWKTKTTFKEGQIIIVNESLRVAKEDFISTDIFKESNWDRYTKHDYSVFNPFHTWTEYINRLFGALSGIPMLLLFILSLFYFKRDWILSLLSFAGIFMLGFEAWLGKLVVDGNLIPGSITIHMLGALFIVALLCLILVRSSSTTFTKPKNKRIKVLIVFALALTLIQTIIGTQVREQIDLLNHNGIERATWIDQLDWRFYFHRSFSIAIVLVNFWLWKINKSENLNLKGTNTIMFLIGLEVLLGIILSYAEMPKLAQPSHLLIGTFLFGLQFFIFSRLFSWSNKEVSNFSNPSS